MNKIIHIKDMEELDLSDFKRGEIHRVYVHLSENALGIPWRIPVVVVRGKNPGKVLGITAAIHGDELNGISTIFKLIKEVDPEKMSGDLVLVPICNVPGYLEGKRYFADNVDLNRVMPGSPDGNAGKIYAHHLTSKIIKKFDYLLDLHTASHGRINSLYIRADLDNEETRTLAYLQNPQIIVKKYDESGTLRGWTNDQGIPTITVEIGNPNAFQHSLIDETLDGILNTMRHLDMIEGDVKDLVASATICDHSFWIYSTRGGIVDVLPNLRDTVKKGEVIAVVYDVFGGIKEEVISSRSGIVIGKNVSPSCLAGARLVHLGVDEIEPEPEEIPGNEEFIETNG